VSVTRLLETIIWHWYGQPALSHEVSDEIDTLGFTITNEANEVGKRTAASFIGPRRLGDEFLIQDSGMGLLTAEERVKLGMSDDNFPRKSSRLEIKRLIKKLNAMSKKNTGENPFQKPISASKERTSD